MRVGLTHCPDPLLRRLSSVLPPGEVVMGALSPDGPAEEDPAAWDVILTAADSAASASARVRWLRRYYRRVPILVVTEPDDSEAAVEALDAGADAVLKKPLNDAELRVRLRCLECRSDPFCYGSLRLNRIRHAVEGPGGSAHLTPREHQLLQCLMLRGERVVSRRELGEAVWWDDDAPPTGNLLDVHISHLRRKLSEVGAPDLIHTIRGVGFFFGHADCAEAAETPDPSPRTSRGGDPVYG